MKTVLIKEIELESKFDDWVFDISKMNIKKCKGCFYCWWTKPGECINKDLEDFYRAYVKSSRAIFYIKIKNGFITSDLKTLFDRMIPLFLPYTTYRGGRTYHLPRYVKYPGAYIFYEGEFEDEKTRNIFYEYISHVFFQFHAKEVKISPVDRINKGEL